MEITVVTTIGKVPNGAYDYGMFYFENFKCGAEKVTELMNAAAQVLSQGVTSGKFEGFAVTCQDLILRVPGVGT